MVSQGNGEDSPFATKNTLKIEIPGVPDSDNKYLVHAHHPGQRLNKYLVQAYDPGQRLDKLHAEWSWKPRGRTLEFLTMEISIAHVFCYYDCSLLNGYYIPSNLKLDDLWALLPAPRDLSIEYLRCPFLTSLTQSRIATPIGTSISMWISRTSQIIITSTSHVPLGQSGRTQ